MSLAGAASGLIGSSLVIWFTVVPFVSAQIAALPL